MENENMVNQFSNGIKNYNKGTFGTCVETLTIPKMNKGGKSGIASNPLFGRVTKITRYTNVRLGVSYESVVRAKLERNGENPDNWQGQASSVGEHYNEYLLKSRKDDNMYYLKIGLFPNTKTESTYFVDGRPATKEEVETINAYLPAKSEPAKQIAAGIPADEVYNIVSPKLENVTLITQGYKVIYSKYDLAVAN